MSEVHLLKIKELSERLRLSEATIYALMKRREIPFLHIRGALLFRESSIERWLSEREQGGNAPRGRKR